jgi:hypothetical protein
MAEGLEWRMSECEFTECMAPSGSSEVGKGGAIFLDLVHPEADLEIRTLTFTTNTAKLGNDVFVQSPSLQISITDNTFALSNVDTPHSQHALPCNVSIEWWSSQPNRNSN